MFLVGWVVVFSSADRRYGIDWLEYIHDTIGCSPRGSWSEVFNAIDEKMEMRSEGTSRQDGRAGRLSLREAWLRVREESNITQIRDLVDEIFVVFCAV